MSSDMTLGPALLGRLPAEVVRPAYDRAALRAGMAHIGVGAFHRCHQAEYTDDLLGKRRLVRLAKPHREILERIEAFLAQQA